MINVSDDKVSLLVKFEYTILTSDISPSVVNEGEMIDLPNLNL